MKLSIIIPAYNEIKSIAEILRLVKEEKHEKEIIVVDDASTDGTKEFLWALNDAQIKVVYNDANYGKGYSLRKGIELVTGDIVIIQDADLEYSPLDYESLIKKMIDVNAPVVFGSRFLSSSQGFRFFQFMGNKVITLMVNGLYKVRLTDVMTCYKVFRTELIKSINLKADGFCVEIDIVADLLKKQYHIFEVPISYNGRTYAQGKKIKWTDFFRCLYQLISSLK